MSERRTTPIIIRGFVVACALVTASVPRSSSAGALAVPAITARLCVSVPGTDLAQLSLGVYHAVMLASERFRPQLARVGVHLENPLLLDYMLNHNMQGEMQDARACVRRPDTVAYIGPINSGVALASEPILNQAGMATISPANTYPALTDPRFRRTQEPATYAHRIPSVTYYRMVPNDLFQGVTAALYLHNQLHGQTYYLVDDQEGYGVPLAEAMNRQAQTLGDDEVGVGHMTVLPSKVANRLVSRLADQIMSVAPDAVYCGCDTDPSAQLARALNTRGFRGAFFVPDEEHNPAWLKLAGPLHTAYASDPGIDDNRAAGWFQRAFTARFHAATQLFDSYAYDAAAAALRALSAAATRHQLSGPITQRRTVVVRYVRRTCFYGASGPVSFDGNGDSNHRSVSVYAGELGSWHLRAVVQLGRPSRCG